MSGPIAMTLAQSGQRLALLGLVLGGCSFIATRPPRRAPRGAIGETQFRISKLVAMPLLLAGVLGLILWGIALVR